VTIDLAITVLSIAGALCLFGVGFGWSLVFYQMKDRHPDAWEEIGAASPYFYGPAAMERLFAFIFRRRHRDLGDPVVLKGGELVYWGLPALLVIAFVLVFTVVVGRNVT
jgi:hypothetical protein